MRKIDGIRWQLPHFARFYLRYRAEERINVELKQTEGVAQELRGDAERLI